MTKSPNDHIRSYLDFYVGHIEPPGYAMMIAGAWGSGKSWLIRQHVKSDSERKYLYISLYGAKTADEVAERIFAARHPILTSKGAVIAGRVLKNLLKVTTTIDIDGDKTGDIQIRPDAPEIMDAVRKNPAYDSHTLIFDDVERCLVGGNELWGFINQLVEQEGAKVILLSHESEIDSKDESYRRTKEKNVGITLTVAPDVVSLLERLIREAHQAAASVLLEHTTQIRILFERSGCTSLRVLRFAVRDFCRIFAELPSELQDAPVVRIRLLNSTLVLAFGIYSGALKPEDFIPVSVALTFGDPSEDKPFKKWVRKYSGSSVSPFSPSLNWWRNFFGRGELQAAELKMACESLVDTSRVPEWLKLAHFDRLSDSDFETLLDETWNKLTAHKYQSVGEILHVVATHMWAIQNQLTASKLTPSTIQTEAKEAIGNLEHESFLDLLSSDEVQGPLYSHAGVAYAAHEVAEFRDLIEYVGQICEVEKKALARLEARRLLKIMTEGVGDFAEALGVTAATDGRVRSAVLQMNVLAEIDPEEFARVLLGLGRSDQDVILGVLYARLKQHMPGEREWVVRMTEKIQEQQSKPSLRGHMLRVKLANLTGNG